MDSYYGNNNVRDRLIEFAGGFDGSGFTCAYFSQCDAEIYAEEALRHSTDLDWFLEQGKEVARSLCDSESLLVHLDVEYVNFDSPTEAFTDPVRAFEIQQPVVNVIEEVLLKWGVTPLHILTGQGHHFVWRIPHGSSPEKTLKKLAPKSAWMVRAYERSCHRAEIAGCRDLVRPFTGLGMVMEFFANEVKRIASERTPVPIDTTAVISGPWEYGKPREIVSLDISEYGDPIHSRMIRMPFTRYMKSQRTWINGLLDHSHPLPEMFVLPLHEMNVHQALEIRQDEEAVVDLAKRASVHIPDESAGMSRLISDYMNSPLRDFHNTFYEEKQHPREHWGETYAQKEVFHLPPCVRDIVENPNDLLLKPAGMQMVVRSLLAEGWHPRHISGFIRYKFSDPTACWEDSWDYYDPGLRAEYYTRLFAGQVATGVDRLIDYNCTSSQEKGMCRNAGGGCSLATFYNNLTNQYHD